MPGYMHPCRYCEKLIPPDSNNCPHCGRVNPLHLRCPRCGNPIRKDHVSCSNCGLELKCLCPGCGKTTFFADYCEHCDRRLTVVCPHRKCRKEQPPVSDRCIYCGKPLKQFQGSDK